MDLMPGEEILYSKLDFDNDGETGVHVRGRMHSGVRIVLSNKRILVEPMSWTLNRILPFLPDHILNFPLDNITYYTRTEAADFFGPHPRIHFFDSKKEILAFCSTNKDINALEDILRDLNVKKKEA